MARCRCHYPGVHSLGSCRRIALGELDPDRIAASFARLLGPALSVAEQAWFEYPPQSFFDALYARACS